jgi:hypothetical protein
VLALHCCTHVSRSVLDLLVAVVPRLEVLMLGGSQIQPVQQEAKPSMLSAVAAVVSQIHADWWRSLRGAVERAQPPLPLLCPGQSSYRTNSARCLLLIHDMCSRAVM